MVVLKTTWRLSHFRPRADSRPQNVLRGADDARDLQIRIYRKGSRSNGAVQKFVTDLVI